MKLKLTGIFLLITLPILGQADLDLPNLSNYQHNWMIYNPAYTGSRDVMSLGFYTRTLKVKDPGGPFYTQASFHTPSSNENVAYGGFASITQSPTVLWPIGSSPETRYTDYQLYGSYSYRIVGSRGRLSMGLYGGATVSTANYSDQFLHAGDPQFPAEDIETLIKPNVGAGFLYYTEKLFVGLSLPRLLNDSIFNGDFNSGFSGFISNYKAVLSGGYEFTVGENLAINPTFILLYGLGDVPDYAGGINFGLFDKRIWFGSVYKSANSIAFNANFQFNSKMLLGIAYDYSLDSKNSYFKNAFEFILRYELREIIETNIPFYY